MSVCGENTAIWEMLAGRWAKAITAKNLSPLTRRSYLLSARRWIGWLAAQGYDLEPAEVRAFHVDEFVVDVIEATSASNGAHHYRNLRVFFGWLVKRAEIVANPMEQTDCPSVPEKITPLLSDDEHRRVLTVCAGSDFVSRRDTAIVLLFIDTGLRVWELASLLAEDINFNFRQFLVRGKGNKVRLVGFGNSAGLALARYLKERARRGATCPELWLSSHGTRGRTRAAASTDSTRMARHYGKQAAASLALDLRDQDPHRRHAGGVSRRLLT